MVIVLFPENLVPSRPEVYSKVIDHYLPSLANGEYDPVMVTKMGGRHIICDGHNRSSGLYLLGKEVKAELIESDSDIIQYKKNLLSGKRIDRVLWETFLFSTDNMEKLQQEIRESLCFLRNQEINSIGDLFVIRPRRRRNIKLDDVKNKLDQGKISIEHYFGMR